MRFNTRIASGLIVVALAVVLAPIPWATPQEYLAIVAGLQAIGLLVTLLIAALTLGANQNDRRVDRVLSLHEDLVSGDVGSARSRLAHHLRMLGPTKGTRKYVLQPRQDELRDDDRLWRYDNAGAEPNATPREDRVLLLRFFERANAACREGTVHRRLFHELIGCHVLWWDAALWLEDHERAHRAALQELSEWAIKESLVSRQLYLKSWARNTSPQGENPDFLHWPPWAELLGEAAGLHSRTAMPNPSGPQLSTPVPTEEDGR